MPFDPALVSPVPGTPVPGAPILGAPAPDTGPHGTERPLRVAVVGSGIAGLSAAWLVDRSSRHHVTLYEREDRLGGHANTVDVPGPAGPVAVDTGFIVYNERNYPNLVALFRHLEVPTKPSEMSFAASIDDGHLEYSGSGLAGLFAQKRNLLRPKFWHMLIDILRFYRDGPRLLSRAGGVELTLGDFLDDAGYSQAFVYNHLLPMAAAIWSTAVADMRSHPAAAFVRFCANHGLMQVARRPQWHTVTGGSRTYVRRLVETLGGTIRADAPVTAIHRTATGAVVTDATGTRTPFDHVVIATHADEALTMLADPSPDESALLGAFRYSRNRAVLHQDPALMPRRRQVWSSWNYMSRGDQPSASASGAGDVQAPEPLAAAPGLLFGTSRVCVTYWMNRLQGLDSRVPLFVTLNPDPEPNPATVLRSFAYDHPSYDLAAMQAQSRLWSLQGERNTWYCGSYFGAGFHEDGLQAGLAVAEALTGERRPWTVADPSGRLQMPDRPAADARSPAHQGAPGRPAAMGTAPDRTVTAEADAT